MKRPFGVVLVGVAIIASVNCGSSSSPPAATGPTPTLITETFTGTVDVGSNSSHQFTVDLSGEVSVNLTAAGPPATIFMGLGIGTFSNAICTLVSNGSAVAQAGANAQLGGTLSSAGTYCVMVYDAGNQTAQVAYTVVVNHF